MNGTIGLFAALGERLRNFGGDARSERVIAEACRVNAWFTPRDIRRAASALGTEMLRPERLAAWLEAYPVPVAVPRRVLVVMAGNIPFAGFFDLLCVVASGHRCLMKPSSKDTVLMHFIVDELRKIDPAVAVELACGVECPDALIATGSDNARRWFRARYAGIPSLLRGSRQSVAVLSGRETAAEWALLADDIWAYSGLGCRSVSLLFLPEDAEIRLHTPADLNPGYRNDCRRSRALLTLTGRPFLDLGDAVAIEQRAFPPALSCIAYSRYRDAAEVEAWLGEHDEELQCVVTECIPHSRRAAFGRAQYPALTDYPDDRDVMRFLTEL